MLGRQRGFPTSIVQLCVVDEYAHTRESRETFLIITKKCILFFPTPMSTPPGTPHLASFPGRGSVDGVISEVFSHEEIQHFQESCVSWRCAE